MTLVVVLSCKLVVNRKSHSQTSQSQATVLSLSLSLSQTQHTHTHSDTHIQQNNLKQACTDDLKLPITRKPQV